MVDRSDPAHWTEFNDNQRGRAVRQLCRTAMTVAGPGDGRLAIDLGCGAGIESAALAGDGWRVLALDSEPGVADRIGAGGIDVREIGFKDLDFLPAAELVHASFSLPYVAPSDFPRVWDLVRGAARDVVAVNLFGVHDSWADDPGMTFFTAAQARELFAGFEIVDWAEEDAPGTASSGPKHWHVFDVVARRTSSR